MNITTDLQLGEFVKSKTEKKTDVVPPKPKEQVGGTHYSSLSIEPIQFIETNEMGYHEGNVVKYVSRWKNKNGLEDLKKAQWYINRLIELNS